MTTWTARPTTYNGIQMRSRLEARIAAELDDAGYEWVYEPRAFASQEGQYLPDFEITSFGDGPPTHPTFMEVRPTLERAYVAMEQMPIIWASEPEARLWILIGDDPLLYTAKGEDRVWRVFQG